ncbi:hypothetical protein B0H14DRAFT_3452399 [Mycena olivaceomarginata]|nr:hypothetical protein B0H14DRAFT_3452399 [Mycena olivaceomarginata]
MNPAGTSPARSLPDIRLSPVPTHPFACPVGQSLVHAPRAYPTTCPTTLCPLAVTLAGIVDERCTTFCIPHPRPAPASPLSSAFLSPHVPHTTQRAPTPLRSARRSLLDSHFVLNPLRCTAPAPSTRSLALPTRTPPLTSPRAALWLRSRTLHHHILHASRVRELD